MTEQQKPIDTRKMIALLRDRALKKNDREILVSRLSGSDQEDDLTLPPNCAGLGRVRHFKHQTAPGWPSNPLPIEPARNALKLETPHPEMTAQVFQNAACPWRCWYCFVPYNLLSADPKRSVWVTAENLVELYQAEHNPSLIIDLSGGSPDLVPEWTVWMMSALDKAGISQRTYLWSDDNLSTTYLFDKLSAAELEQLQTYPNYGRVCCFKGFDESSFTFNTQAEASGLDEQFHIMKRLLELDIDLYGYITLTTPEQHGIESKMCTFFDRLQALHENLPLRIIPLRIGSYGPVHDRMNEARERSIRIQEDVVACWASEIEKRFSAQQREAPIFDVSLKNTVVQ